MFRQLAIQREHIGGSREFGLHLPGASALQLFRGREGERRFGFGILRALQPAREPAVAGFAARLAVAVTVIELKPGDVIGEPESSVHALDLVEGGARSANREEVANGGQHEKGLAAECVQVVRIVQPVPEPQWEDLLGVLRADALEHAPPRGDVAGGRGDWMRSSSPER